MRQEFQDKVRIQVNRFIFENGFAPTVAELSRLLETSDSIVKAGLQQLADNHAIVLHPHSSEIWVAHPFALFPTLFWVESGDKKWWGNCAWCSLGIASLTRSDTDIHTKICGEAELGTIEIRNGSIASELLVHFAIPANRLWDNVIYTCANMLVFRNEGQVDEWCARHRVSKGEVLPVQKVWELAQLWYGNYLDDSWTRKTPEYASSIFEKVGLTSPFWKL